MNGFNIVNGPVIWEADGVVTGIGQTRERGGQTLGIINGSPIKVSKVWIQSAIWGEQSDGVYREFPPWCVVAVRQPELPF